VIRECRALCRAEDRDCRLCEPLGSLSRPDRCDEPGRVERVATEGLEHRSHMGALPRGPFGLQVRADLRPLLRGQVETMTAALPASACAARARVGMLVSPVEVRLDRIDQLSALDGREDAVEPVQRVSLDGGLRSHGALLDVQSRREPLRVDARLLDLVREHLEDLRVGLPHRAASCSALLDELLDGRALSGRKRVELQRGAEEPLMAVAVMLPLSRPRVLCERDASRDEGERADGSSKSKRSDASANGAIHGVQ
jgi:hypothetical protein